eukprot:CAMPEP_0184681134 /NCGR_PEP_ID=MMETSP0312-20130426/4090_1 /TAXON_ID=31354 /ORGANISM="Compsopogon coeruleus, Strain SAG 36.94" /LENGTH=52 /DNA_ID=CAMNT_0027131763 /DNA_START=218 /DNA_END=376 /DNA_ORIENTATION=+
MTRSRYMFKISLSDQMLYSGTSYVMRGPLSKIDGAILSEDISAVPQHSDFDK